MVESTRRKAREREELNNRALGVHDGGGEGPFEETGQIEPDGGTSQVSILTTKLHRPAVASDILPRDRLLEELNDGFQRPLSLISAPAGYGKSTLASRWVESCDCPNAWISLDESDNDPRLFLTYLLTALQRVEPEVGQRTSLLLEGRTLPQASVLAPALLNDLEDVKKPFILVLDDYHEIRQEAIHNLLAELLRHPPPGMHLVLTTRRDPPLPLDRLRARAQMKEIAMEQLRFTTEETEEFLQRIFRIPVDESTAALLGEKTEGWVTGLRLAALSLRNQQDLERAVGELKGGFYNVSQYFVSEVLSRQSPERARYLMETSVLDRFCAPLCGRLHSNPQDKGSETSCEEFIEWLEEANLFVVPLDMEHHWFRYHHLFQELLQDELRRRHGQDEIVSLHERASSWFMENQLIDEAIQHSLKAGDIVGAADIIEGSADDQFRADRWYVVDRWLGMLPAGIRSERPGLLLTEAWVSNLRYQMSRVPGILEQVESLIDGQTADSATTGKLDFFRGYFTYFEGEADSAQGHLEDAVSKLSGLKTPFLGEAQLMLGLARCMGGQKQLAVQRLESGINQLDKSEGQLLSRLIASLVFINLIDGNLPRARIESERLQLVARNFNMRLTEAWSSYMLGCSYLHAGEFEAASHHFDRVVELRYVLELMAAFDALAGLALTQQFMRLDDKAAETVNRMLDFAKEQNEPQFLSLIQSCRARLNLLQGDASAAVRWAGSFSGTPTPAELFMWLEVPSISRVRALVGFGSAESLGEATETLAAMKRLTEKWRFTCQTIEITVLQSLALEKQGRAEDALKTLEEALTLAEPGGWIRPFLELGPEMAEMLQRLDGKKDFTAQVLAAFESPVAPEPSQPDLTENSQARPARVQTGLDDLTNREFDILELLAQRLQNKEIGEQLFISTHTVNYHLKHIYDKLGVHGRRQAVDRAVELGILER